MADQTNYFKHQFSGLGSSGAYQVSGYPYITGSIALANSQEDHIRFPGVTKSVTVINRPSGSGDAPDIRVHFASTADSGVVNGRHFITLTSNKDSMTMNVKCTELFISRNDPTAGNAAYTVFAEITGIQKEQMFPLTGSGITEQ
jgi:hypothetical protein|tara:strand:+ start:132 stop:563 length:432 start_codon:yes stop_codon:yes gene_type:complete